MRRIAAPLVCMLLLTALLPACEKEEPELGLADLTGAESLYVSRIVVLERAKAIALVDRKLGNAVLDSLHAAWGDSALPEALAGAPTAPRRSARVHALLVRILEAERDSLLEAPRVDRLGAPLPDPPPAPVDPEPQK